MLKEALNITGLGMGIVFLVLAIDYTSIVLVGILAKKARVGFQESFVGLKNESTADGKLPSMAEAAQNLGQISENISLRLGGAEEQEVAAIIGAIWAWEEEQGGFHNRSDMR